MGKNNDYNTLRGQLALARTLEHGQIQPPAAAGEALDPLLSIAERVSGSVYARIRRIFDVAAATLALLPFALLLPLIALIIRIDSPGPVFFVQERVGLDRRRRRDRRNPLRQSRMDPRTERRRVLRPGRPIRVIKLRTMRIDAEADGPQLASRNDARVTRIGRILRLIRADEVPQFLNVLTGEMSLIGPRPERLCFTNRFESEVPGYIRRLKIMPGITGLAQVENGYDEDLESVRRKVTLDLHYMENLGPLIDMSILAKTVKVVLTAKGAR